ncbi:thiolase family protein [Bradyrhizobium sp. CCBAU 51753]|uniref:thiolase family protein n=1 Tax=Bradyrhizobium sp. CCBAU 51753 TaxID=1325100 RepID=UPI00188BF75F|nr:thiolase family protein [Bradyrhizobium sp. CCBAU 51753]QOZ23867.1 thiolase family protein [Bradyrhizobium sp. CCBAU 51753]
MAIFLKDLRPVYVIGVGWHRYQPLSETPYVALGLQAIRQALADARIAWPDVESSYIGTGRLGTAPGRPMLKHLGDTGRPLVHIENASASGSAAFRHACIEVASGMADVCLAAGVDKPPPAQRAKTGIDSLADDAILPFTHFALLTNEYAQKHGVKPEDIALVAVKNHRNGSLNPNAHRQQKRSLDEVLAGKGVSGTLTTLQCCPVGEGAAAVIIASEYAIKRLGTDAGRAIRIAASAASSERPGPHATVDAVITQATIADALQQTGLKPRNLDVLELHDAFTVEELEYVEAMGICEPGQAIHLLKEGAFDIGGRVAVSPSGGLIAMGHPLGPTGIGQIGEITIQLRGEAGPRQHKAAKIGLAHMVGVGAVCYAHILQKS